MTEIKEYKGKTIEVDYSQGNGNFLAPLTNCPFSYKIKENGIVKHSHYHCASSLATAFGMAETIINSKSFWK